MYRVIHCNDQMHGAYRVFEYCETLEEAREARKVSGDIVVDDEGAVVTDPSWLFSWETEESYAGKIIKWQERCPEPYLRFMECREVE